MRRVLLPMQFARGLLLLLSLVLPFEAPLFHVGPLQITTVELVLYATLAAWGLGEALEVARDRSALPGALATLRTDRMVQAALVWAAVTFASALAAPSDRGAAFKFALRSLSGILVFFAARSLASRGILRRRMVLAILAGALVSAVTAVVDSFVPNSDVLWEPFRAGRFSAFALTRASGVFAYPTIGAMDWEAALPLLIVAPFLGARTSAERPPSRRRHLAETAVIVLAGALLVGAILASATRSALVGSAVAASAMMALGWNVALPLRSAAAAVLATIAVMSAVPLAATSAGSLLGQRLRWWQDDAWFGAEYRVDRAPRTVTTGETFAVPVRMRNTGTLTWTREGDKPFRLSQHWARPQVAMSAAAFDGIRTELPADVPPGGTIEVAGRARAPMTPGTYQLRWDLLQEGVTWFSERGNAVAEQEVRVTLPRYGPTSGARTLPAEAPLQPMAPPPPSRLALWRAAVILWRHHPLLGIGPDNFRRRYQTVLPPSPNGQPYTDTRIHANSFYFETLADLGLAGVAALGFLAFALARLLRSNAAGSDGPGSDAPGSDGSGRIEGLATAVAASAFFVHGWLDYFLEFTPLFCLFWMLLGLAAACRPEIRHASVPSSTGCVS